MVAADLEFAQSRCGRRCRMSQPRVNTVWSPTGHLLRFLWLRRLSMARCGISQASRRRDVALSPDARWEVVSKTNVEDPFSRGTEQKLRSRWDERGNREPLAIWWASGLIHVPETGTHFAGRSHLHLMDSDWSMALSKPTEDCVMHCLRSRVIQTRNHQNHQKHQKTPPSGIEKTEIHFRIPNWDFSQIELDRATSSQSERPTTPANTTFL